MQFGERKQRAAQQRMDNVRNVAQACGLQVRHDMPGTFLPAADAMGPETPGVDSSGSMCAPSALDDPMSIAVASLTDAGHAEGVEPVSTRINPVTVVASQRQAKADRALAPDTASDAALAQLLQAEEEKQAGVTLTVTHPLSPRAALFRWRRRARRARQAHRRPASPLPASPLPASPLPASPLPASPLPVSHERLCCTPDSGGQHAAPSRHAAEGDGHRPFACRVRRFLHDVGQARRPRQGAQRSPPR